MSVNDPVSLREFVNNLRTELWKAICSHSEKPLTFMVQEVEIELEVSTERTVEATGETTLGFKVLGIGTEAKGGGGTGTSRGTSQKIRMKLIPKLDPAPGDPVRHSRPDTDKPFRIPLIELKNLLKEIQRTEDVIENAGKLPMTIEVDEIVPKPKFKPDGKIEIDDTQ